MSDIKNLERGKKIAYKLFEKTGDPRYYGAYRGFDEKMQEKIFERENCEPGMG